MVQGSGRGVGFSLLASDFGHWCLTGTGSSLLEVVISKSGSVLPPLSPLGLPRHPVLGTLTPVICSPLRVQEAQAENHLLFSPEASFGSNTW